MYGVEYVTKTMWCKSSFRHEDHLVQIMFSPVQWCQYGLKIDHNDKSNKYDITAYRYDWLEWRHSPVVWIISLIKK